MKRSFKPHSPRHHQGFALVVTLSLMVLLTMLAIGLLSLSVITLRASSQGDAMATARANARLALMMAVGELQAHAGPDTRITATGSIMDGAAPSKSHLTGVWDSWRIEPGSLPSASDYQKDSGKEQRFRKWLVSSADPLETEDAGFISSSDLPESQRVTLVPELKNAEAVHAGLVPVAASASSGSSAGSYAYAVFDEGVKARIDTGYKNGSGTALGDLALRMGAGVRADISLIEGLEKIDWSAADLSSTGSMLHKAVSFENGALMLDQLGGIPADYQDLFHEISTSSLGVFADVANGGLKQDLNSILNATSLPSDFSGAADSRMYTQHLDYSVTNSGAWGWAEPSWMQLFGFSNLYKSTLRTRGGMPLIITQAPNWNKSSPIRPPGTAALLTPTLMPSVVKVQYIFTAITVPLAWDRDVRSPSVTKPTNWTEGSTGTTGNLITAQSRAWDKGARYFVMLGMSPTITLHNPYNVNLEVNNLAVEVSGIPASLQLARRAGGSGTGSGWQPGEGQGIDWLDHATRSNPDRKFTFNLFDDEAGNVSRFTLAPGELRSFTPKLPGGTNYRTHDYRTWILRQTHNDTIRLAKGYRGDNFGIFFPRLSDNTLTEAHGSFEYLAPSDELRFRFRPCLDARNPSVAANRGKAQVTLVDAGNPNRVYSAISLDIGTDKTDGNLLTGLEEALDSGPDDAIETDWIRATDMALDFGYSPFNSAPYKELALLTLSAKTTHGNMGGNKTEGSMSAKPMAFHSSTAPFAGSAVGDAGLEPYAHEVSLIKLDPAAGLGSDYFLDKSINQGKSYAFSGLTVQKGLSRATVYEIPTGPLMSFSQLNSANIASTNSVARFAYPIGNSWAHPMIPPNNIMAAAPNNMSVAAYDHSFLLNSLLFDKFYFSGIAPRQGRFMTSIDTETLARTFVENPENSQLPDKRLIPYLSDGADEEDAIAALSTAHSSNAGAPQARFSAAAYQLMKGSFNVNSTSKEVWKAMLASLRPESARMLLSAENSPQATLADLKTLDTKEARFSRFLLPNSDAPENAGDRQNVFQGPRDISESELDALAEQIVEQVRLRGPFLSMAEFVNRQIGSSDLAQKGALQAAIDATAINSNSSVLANTGHELPALSKYTNSTAMAGRSDQGAAGYLSQADLLSVLGNAATVRSDTFTIRSYGDARDRSGNIIARAWCEATVQRVPEYIDPHDKSQVAPGDLNSPANQTFGRRFVVRSFRWLSPADLAPSV